MIRYSRKPLLRAVVLAAVLALSTAPQAAGGQFVFSKAPINPASPANLTTTFQSGDHIYALIQVDRPWREMLKAQNKTEAQVMIILESPSGRDYQYITLKSPAALDSKTMLLDIAPEPSKMTTYKDPSYAYGEGRGYRKIGPIAFTYNMGQLAGGKHSLKFSAEVMGDQYASGSLAIEGGDYKFYAALHEKVKAAETAGATMPEAKMVDKAMEANMRKLLMNAGWTNVARLVIVDKDWWLDRASGGDSPIVSRHIAAAAATKDADGYFYKVCTFHQRRLITGAFGPLELTDQGMKRKIAAENVAK